MSKGPSLGRPATVIIVVVFVAIAVSSSEAPATVRLLGAVAFFAIVRVLRGFTARERRSRREPTDPAWTPLHEAVNEKNFDQIPDLLAAGISVDARDGGGMTPLHIAVQAGNLEGIENLIGYGADVTAVDETESTVLVMALVRGHPDLVPALLMAGADPDAVNSRGMSARSLASDMGLTHLLGAG